MSKETEIQFKKALILGNFYNQKVKIVTKINESYGVIMDAIVGVKENFAVTQDNGMIDRAHIQSIYKIA